MYKELSPFISLHASHTLQPPSRRFGYQFVEKGFEQYANTYDDGQGNSYTDALADP